MLTNQTSVAAACTHPVRSIVLFVCFTNLLARIHNIITHEQGLLELAVTAQRAVVAAEPDGRVTSTNATSSATSANGGNSTTTSSAGGARRSSGDSSRASASSSSSSAQQPSGYAVRCVYTYDTCILLKHAYVLVTYVAHVFVIVRSVVVAVCDARKAAQGSILK
jgi:hypothetical protein